MQSAILCTQPLLTICGIVGIGKQPVWGKPSGSCKVDTALLGANRTQVRAHACLVQAGQDIACELLCELPAEQSSHVPCEKEHAVFLFAPQCADGLGGVGTDENQFNVLDALVGVLHSHWLIAGGGHGAQQVRATRGVLGNGDRTMDKRSACNAMPCCPPSRHWRRCQGSMRGPHEGPHHV